LFHDQTEATDGDRARQREGWPARKGQEVPGPRSIAGAIQRLADLKRGSNGQEQGRADDHTRPNGRDVAQTANEQA